MSGDERLELIVGFPKPGGPGDRNPTRVLVAVAVRSNSHSHGDKDAPCL